MNKNLSLYEIYKLSLKLSGKSANTAKKMLLAYALSSAFLGLSYALFFPLIACFFDENFDINLAFLYLCPILIFGFISLALKYYAFDFSYTDKVTKIAHDLRLKLGIKLKNIPLQKLASYKTGELNNTLSQNVDDSILHLGVVAGMFFEATLLPISVIFCLFFIDIKIALILFLAVFLIYPLYKLARTLGKIQKAKELQAHKNLEADTLEYFQGLAVLRSLNQVGKNSLKLQKSIKEVKTIQRQGIIKGALPNALLNAIVEFVFLGLLLIGSFWVANGSLEISSLLALLVIMARLIEPTSLFLSLITLIELSKEAIININKILDIKELEIFSPKEEIKNFDISFEGVNFSYQNQNKKALKDINLLIKENSFTAIVGPSGSGKTTLIKLISRYDDLDSGSIRIGGADIKTLSGKELMKNLAVVFQDVYLFDDTILNNIKMAKGNASKDEVIEACKKAHCHEFIHNLEKGYETRVGEIGGNLSGGEKQRISIARAILKDAPIVILDEPTSALDTRSELAVQKALDELIKSKTVIVIAHRLSTISHADNIVVIEDGKIIESGKHEDLISKKAKYYTMYEAFKNIKEWNI